MKAASIIIVLVLTLGGTYCQASELTGEIFVITEGANNIRLGRVKVAAYDATEVKNAVLAIDKKVEAFRSVLDPYYPTLLKAVESAEVEYYKSSHSGGVESPYLELRKEEQIVSRGWHALHCAGLYFAALPQTPIATAMSDSEGKYTMSLPKGDYVLLSSL